MKEKNNIKTRAKIRHLIMTLLLLLPLGTSAQIMDNSHRVDTLTLAERFTVRTNAVDWVLMVPNIGFEFDIFPQNYNQWSVGVNLRYRPHTSSTNVFPAIFDIFEVSLEGRQYWRERQATPTGYLRPHLMWYDKILSCRNMMPSHPKWIFYRGGYVAYTKYSYFLDGIFNGRQGTAYQLGFTWGFTTPLYNFQNGNSVSLECGVSLGACYKKESKYKYDKRNNIYYYYGDEAERDKGEFCKYPVLKDLHVALAYHFGNYPIQKKYRWRYDADIEYRSYIDSLYLDSESKALTRYINDSVYQVVYSDFRQVYDSVLTIIQKEEADEALARTAQRKLELKEQLDSLDRANPRMSKEEKKAAKARAKAERDSLKALDEAELARHIASAKAAKGVSDNEADENATPTGDGTATGEATPVGDGTSTGESAPTGDGTVPATEDQSAEATEPQQNGTANEQTEESTNQQAGETVEQPANSTNEQQTSESNDDDNDQSEEEGRED